MIFSLLFAATAMTVASQDPFSEPAEEALSTNPVQEVVQASQEQIEPFTGKITGSKVRLRLRASLDGYILRELSQGDLLVVTGEKDEFYAVMPERTVKGYLYRAYVLDNVVEANNVNLRLDADTQAPIITQMNQGTHVTGTFCSKNNKWLEIDLPEDIRFYVAKEYVNKVGDVAYFQRTEAKREHAKTRFAALQEEIASELKKPFSDINLAHQVNELKELGSLNQDRPEYADKVNSLVKSTQDEYLQLSEAYQSSLKKVEKSTQVAMAETPRVVTQEEVTAALRCLSSSLEQQETKLIAQALEAGNAVSKEAFYAAEFRIADALEGQLVPYNRAVKNRPGDFMLVDAKTKVPLAYLYSSRVDLSPHIGKAVQILVSERPNHDFALPAYFVLEAKPDEQR